MPQSASHAATLTAGKHASTLEKLRQWWHVEVSIKDNIITNLNLHIGSTRKL